MPIPKPRPDEKEEAYVGRCMAAIGDEYEDKDQALAVCYSTFKEGRKKQMNDQLLEAIRQRQAATEFGYGITTADRYAKNVLDAVGLEVAYKCAATRTISWDDVMRKAARTLVYSNPDMITEEIEYSRRAGSTLKKLDDVELPKNCLMVFRHVLTTPRKDRDGDVLRTGGAKVDPKMILLWNHVHTLPIGKMLAVSEHNSKKLSLVSCIVDMNDLSHDCAVMIDNGMGRFSHGFRAIEFTKIKAADGEKEAGFDVKDFEIMEESLVTVPSNTDAEVEELMLGLVEGGKMTSPIMKEYGKSIRVHRPVQVVPGLDLQKVSLPIDLKITLNGKEISHEDLSGDGSRAAEGAERAEKDAALLAKEADAKAAGKAEEAATDDKVACPECGTMMSRAAGAECPKCGYVLKKGDVDEEEEEEPEETKSVKSREWSHRVSTTTSGDAGPNLKSMLDHIKITANAGHSFSVLVDPDAPSKEQMRFDFDGDGADHFGDVILESLSKSFAGTKFGRTFSRKNLTTLKEIHGDVEELDRGDHVLSVRGREITKGCRTKIKAMIDEYDIPDGVEEDKAFTGLKATGGPDGSGYKVGDEITHPKYEGFVVRSIQGEWYIAYHPEKKTGKIKFSWVADESDGSKSFSVEDAMGVLIAEATQQQRQTVQKAFDAIEEVERANLQAKQYREMFSR